MTAAKVLDVISRLPGCAGAASDAVSACTHVNMGGAPKIVRTSGVGMLDCSDSSTSIRWPTF